MYPVAVFCHVGPHAGRMIRRNRQVFCMILNSAAYPS